MRDMRTCPVCGAEDIDANASDLELELYEARDLLVEIAKVVYGPDYSEPYDDPRALAGLVDAVRVGWVEKERLRVELERHDRADAAINQALNEGDGGYRP